MTTKEALKSQRWNKEDDIILPSYFDDEDREKYDEYLYTTQQIPHKCPIDFVKMLIIAEINKEKGRGIEVDKKKVEELKDFYLSNIKPIYNTPSSVENNSNFDENNISIN